MTKATRRDFIKRSALAGATIWASGRITRAGGTPPSERLNIGIIGCGGKGESDAANSAKTETGARNNIVALCDVDHERGATTFKNFPQATRYHDYRKMLEIETSLDAVTVSTPDHNHAAASILAMKLGKHVYCQKPLSHSVFEARRVRQVAKETGVATQMGNQIAAADGARRGIEVLQAGAIGSVREAHVWSNRPVWLQGEDGRPETRPVPDHVKWDLWLGPAPWRPYGEGYCPFVWRGWWDFGTGALGDMACHTVHLPFLALKLGYPASIEALSTRVNTEMPPSSSVITYQFPARENLPPVKLTWYDGGMLPPSGILPGVQYAPSGLLLVGDEGIFFSPDPYGANWTLYPEEKFADYKGPAPTLPRSPGHHQEWVDACKGGPPAVSNFDSAALLTEILLLGNLAVRTGQKLDWDGPSMKATNCPAADQYVQREYRKGWAV